MMVVDVSFVYLGFVGCCSRQKDFFPQLSLVYLRFSSLQVPLETATNLTALDNTQVQNVTLPLRYQRSS